MRISLFALLLTSLALVGCDASAPAEPTADALTANHADDAPSIREAIMAARRGTARYQTVARAEAAGWHVASPCVEAPPGGMGFHYVNGGLMDGALDAATPEALLYEPTPSGKLRLVGVEYIVPFGVAPAEGPAPEFYGLSLHRNDALGFWALHAWIWKSNPAGMFADFNPRVSCEHAPEG